MSSRLDASARTHQTLLPFAACMTSAGNRRKSAPFIADSEHCSSFSFVSMRPCIDTQCSLSFEGIVLKCTHFTIMSADRHRITRSGKSLQVSRSASQHVCLTLHYIYWSLCKCPAMYEEPSGVTCDPLGTPAAAPCMHNIACLQLLNSIIAALLLHCCECNRVSMYSHAEHQLHQMPLGQTFATCQQLE